MIVDQPAAHGGDLEGRALQLIRHLGLWERHHGSPSLDPIRHEYLYTYPPPASLDRWSPADVEYLAEDPVSHPLGVYIHIPFCKHSCSLCHYVKFDGTSRSERKSYLECILVELRLLESRVKMRERSVTSVHFGGGTPTLLSGSELNELLQCVRASLPVAPTAEITMEASPETVTPGKMESVRDVGVNRLSLGVQTLDDAVLARAGRGHSAAEALSAFATARQAGFGNINVDLIYGLPGQTPDSWRETLMRTLDVLPEQVTLYCLRLKRGSLLAQSVCCHDLPSPSTVLLLNCMAFLAFRDRGYVQTIANSWVRSPRFVYRHQYDKFSMGEYAGVGVSAHSFLNRCVYVNECALDRYIGQVREGRLGIASGTRLDNMQMMRRAMILALKRGLVDSEWFQEMFGKTPSTVFPEQIEQLVHEGLLENRRDGITVTLEGMLFINEAARAFFEDRVWRALADPVQMDSLSTSVSRSARATAVACLER